MANNKRSRVVQTVFRPASVSDALMAANKGIVKPNGGSRLTHKEVETIAARNPARGKVLDLPVHNASLKERNKALIGPKKRTPPKEKVMQRQLVKPKATKHVKPHILKSTSGLPLVDRLNDILLAQLRQRIVTNKQAAQALDVHPNYLSRVVAGMQDKTPGPVRSFRLGRSKLAKARNHTRIELAKSVHRGDITIEKACKQANCSERTMYRWMSKYANLKTTKKA